MRRVAPSKLAREQLQDLLAGGVDRESNIVSALVETVTRLVVQELLEGEQRDILGGRGRMDGRDQRSGNGLRGQGVLELFAGVRTRSRSTVGKPLGWLHSSVWRPPTKRGSCTYPWCLAAWG